MFFKTAKKLNIFWLKYLLCLITFFLVLTCLESGADLGFCGGGCGLSKKFQKKIFRLLLRKNYIKIMYKNFTKMIFRKKRPLPPKSALPYTVLEALKKSI